MNADQEMRENEHYHSQPTDRDRIRRIRRFYDMRHASEANWDSSAYLYGLRNPVGFYLRQKTYWYLIQMLNQHNVALEGKGILDIGCGYGIWLRFFAEVRGSSHGLTGIDITPQRIVRASGINPGIEFIIGDALSLPFPDNSFDIVSQFDTFEHFVDKINSKKAALELTRVLKNRGLLLWFDLLPFPGSANSITRGYSLEEIKVLFPEFELLAFRAIFKRFNFGFRIISTVYDLPRFSFMLADIAEKLPFGKHINLMVLMRKNA